MRVTNKFLTGAAVIILALFTGASVRAQNPGTPQDQTAAPDQVAPQDQGNPPDQNGPDTQGTPDDQNAPGVARVSMIKGDVTVQRGDSNDIVTATMNMPLNPGDKLMTGNNSRAEIQLDFANVLRLADNSSASIATLNRSQIQVQIGEGLAYYSQFRGNEASVEIDSPNVAIQPDKESSMSVFVNSGGQTEVTVRHGETTMSTPQGSTRVRTGQMITVQGTGSDVQYKVTDAPAKTDWDAFNQDRDRLIERADSWKHTDRYYTGTQDLDPYGKWTEVPDYGQVWVPNQGPGWAPYSDGSWVWEPYWGWTWVSYEPWGWAPYHYGRWFVYGGNWAWWPGPVYGGFGFGYGFYRPIWAPAYVSFFGFGPGIGVGFGFGFGTLGWLPIGPGDFFHPWWGGFRDRFGVVGIHDVNGFRGGWGPLRAGDRFSNIHNMWTNDRVRSGLSTVAANGFGHGAVHATPASLDNLRNARGMTGNLPVVPSHESLSASGGFRGVGARSNQSFFSKNTPSARPESFSQQASHMQQAIQRDGHFSTSGADNTRNTLGSRTNPVTNDNIGQGRNNANDGTASRPSGNGQSFGGARASGFSDRPPSTGSTSTRTQAPSDGWQRFNSPNGGNGSANTSRQPSGSYDRPTGNSGYDRNTSGYGSQGTRPQYSQPSYRAPSGYGSSGSYRPPLQMSKPMVTPRSYGGYGNNGRSSTPSRPPSRSSGGSARAPSSHGSSAPSHGSSHSSGGGHSSGGHHR